MIRDEIEAVETTSPNLLTEQTEQLKHIFPQIFSEGKIDFKKLRAALGDLVDTQPERYNFSWAGKRNATLLLQTPSYGTLIPLEDESINFKDTQNLFIEGDNLEVLKLLYKSYSGRVKMIYIDPPYNTGNDFVYPDNFTDPLETYLEITGQKDAHGNLLTSNPETSGRYHSAWLSMLYPRLYLARQLLRDDGVIFVSIDDHEIHNLRLLMNEIFGEENFVATIVWQKKQSPQNDSIYLSQMHDYILVYAKAAKSSRQDSHGWLMNLLQRTELQNSRFSNPDNDPRGEWASVDCSSNKSASQRPNLYYSVINPITGEEVWPSKQRVWRYEKGLFNRLIKENRIAWGAEGKSFPRQKRFLSEVQAGIIPSTWWSRDFAGDNQEATREIRSIFTDDENLFDTPKPPRLIKRILEISSAEDDLILDFFAGSCTTAQSVLELNREDDGSRRFVMVQLPELTNNTQFPTIAEIGKERIRRVIARMKQEDKGKLELSTREEPEDLGFRVFKLVPSNYKVWKSTTIDDPEAYANQLDMFADPLIEKWNPINVLWEVAVKEGFGLNAQIERIKEVQDNIVWRITDPDKDQSLLICLDDELNPSMLSALPLAKDHVFVCRNKALDDTKAANLALQCRLKKI